MSAIDSGLQKAVQEAIDELVESGNERGLQVSVYRDGEPVADAAAGVADPATGRPMTAEAPIYGYSIGKGVTATVAHVLVERGAFAYDTPVAEVWPEFGAHGKGGVTVRHVLDHSAGVPGIPLDTTPADLCDWDKMCAAIAGSEPWWEPGTKIGYHAYTFGYILGEVVRRATGRPISVVLREDVAEPLGVADEIYFGMPESEQGRLAPLEDSEGAAAMMASMPADHPMFKTAPAALSPTAEMGNRTDILAADIPAGGKNSARAIARMYAALLGEVDGVRLLTPERLSAATAVSSSGNDEIFGMPSSWGLGYGLGWLDSTGDDAPTRFGMGGAGGSFAGADTATGIAFAMTKNRLTPDFQAATRIIQIITDA